MAPQEWYAHPLLMNSAAIVFTTVFVRGLDTERILIISNSNIDFHVYPKRALTSIRDTSSLPPWISVKIGKTLMVQNRDNVFEESEDGFFHNEKQRMHMRFPWYMIAFKKKRWQK